MLSQIVSALGVVVVAVFACSAYFYFSNKILDLALPVKDGDIRAASRNLNRRALVRPWLFIGPALFLLIVYLVYPVVATFILSFYDRAGLQSSASPITNGRSATANSASRSSTTSSGSPSCRLPAPSSASSSR